MPFPRHFVRSPSPERRQQATITTSLYCGGENCCGLIFEAHLQLREFPQPRLVAYHVTEHISTTAVLCKLEEGAHQVLSRRMALSHRMEHVVRDQ
jgi:hypothetical protein